MWLICSTWLMMAGRMIQTHMMGFWLFHLPSEVLKYNVWPSLQEVCHWLYWVQTLALAKRWSDAVDWGNATIGYSEDCVNRPWDDIEMTWIDTLRWQIECVLQTWGFPIDRGHVTAWGVLTRLPTSAKALPGQSQEPQRYWCSLALHHKLEPFRAFGVVAEPECYPMPSHAYRPATSRYAIFFGRELQKDLAVLGKPCFRLFNVLVDWLCSFFKISAFVPMGLVLDWKKTPLGLTEF